METYKPKWFKDLRFVDFKIIEEPWNVYELADGSILKARLVLTTVLTDGDLAEAIRKVEATKEGKRKMKLPFAIRGRPAVIVQIPKSVRGSPSQAPGLEEGTAPLEEIKFDTVSEKWNEYELEEGVRLRVKYTVVKVDKTNKYDEQGIPHYNVDGSVILRIVPPKQMVVK